MEGCSDVRQNWWNYMEIQKRYIKHRGQVKMQPAVVAPEAIEPFNRHLYRELAKMTNIKELRLVYAKAHARAYRKENPKEVTKNG